MSRRRESFAAGLTALAVDPTSRACPSEVEGAVATVSINEKLNAVGGVSVLSNLCNS